MELRLEQIEKSLESGAYGCGWIEGDIKELLDQISDLRVKFTSVEYELTEWCLRFGIEPDDSLAVTLDNVLSFPLDRAAS